MKSPITGGKMTLQQENTVLTFRKEAFHYTKLYYRCEDSGECFTDTELDEINMGQIYNQYRVKYGIPFPDEILMIRTKYGLSAAKMSEILGFGDNQYRLYESGEIPSQANGKTLKTIMNPSFFIQMVHNSKHQFSPNEYLKIVSKIEKSGQIDEKCRMLEQFIYDGYERSLQNGYATQSYVKLKNILLFFIEKMDGVFCTKMNKLLFYLDFLSYKKQGIGITGLAYQAIQYGPVPVRWDRVYSLTDDIHKEIQEWENGSTGEKLTSGLSPDLKLFSEKEIELLHTIAHTFKNISAASISTLSHREDAWIKYLPNNQIIDYTEAFTLKAI